MNSSVARRPWWLYALTLAAFVVQTDDFIIVGVLPEMAADLRVAEPTAGQLVTAYSLVYALAAPAWSLVLTRVSRRAALMCALAFFTAVNFAVLAVGSYPQLMVLRVLAAGAAAVALPSALAVAGALAPAERTGRYLATVMLGLTGAVLVGVPASTWIGAGFGWRATFTSCGLIGIAAFAGVALALPAVETPRGQQRETFAGLLRPLLSGAVAAILVVTVLVVAGNLAFQTYISVYMADLAGAGPRTLAVLLVCAGVGGIVGTRTSGWLADRYKPLRAFALACGVFCTAMLALGLLWLVRPVPAVFVAGLLLVWSASAWAVPPSIQVLMLSRSGTRAAAQAMAVSSSSAYVGSALGGALGGTVVALDEGLLSLVAIALVAAGLVLALLTLRVPVTEDEPSAPAEGEAPRGGRQHSATPVRRPLEDGPHHRA
ncbi:MFS transporter [Kitasatospora sp. NPDC086801]|uniref:MFS transporter n=1 Tax=Kitasatospora sp. NPDC086801 TaxID=3364066 RepID=UPI003803DC0A